ncbi:NADPH-dependent F420 reductase [Phytohabitans suffuscus]|uniref:NADP oxidoreductase n=1 Tax=Phytohabitans suffuscus TaxID=624315 RepID=A0A6F8YRJ5_9ACTN|nr:NADPH-dependent F420 reductase [Phytohabitans suffuscus]BCB88770.1 NADP oxidoreductase [Phytohabitans suffuscus]
MVRTLALIGSGNIGGAVARLAVAAGVDVILSNARGPESLADLVAELGERSRAATPVQAAQAGDLVVATIPMHAYRQLPASALAGKTVIDTMNYYPDRDGRIPELEAGTLTSSALVQQHLADSRVVKAFNNIDFRRLFTLARPVGDPDRSALPISGDDRDAKAEVADLLDTLGYDSVDIGSLADSWRSQPGTPVYVQPYFPFSTPTDLSQEAIYRWYLQTPGVPIPAEQVRRLADAAARTAVDDSGATSAHG